MSLPPQHLAVIMDGNRRWAKANNLPVIKGHQAGAEATRKLVEFTQEENIKFLTLFCFSIENWQRSKQEVRALNELLTTYLNTESENLHKKNVKVTVIGQIENFESKLQKSIAELVTRTAKNTGIQLQLAMSYSGQFDITQACQKIAQAVKNNEVDVDSIDQSYFESHLLTYGTPPVDLVIRTGNEIRISNFLLWQTAYSELVFLPQMWPEFSKPQFNFALAQYQQRQRRFGV